MTLKNIYGGELALFFLNEIFSRFCYVYNHILNAFAFICLIPDFTRSYNFIHTYCECVGALKARMKAVNGHNHYIMSSIMRIIGRIWRIIDTIGRIIAEN